MASKVVAIRSGTRRFAMAPLFLSTVMPVTAFAQAAPESQPQTNAGTDQIEGDILVTARRRAERITDVPIAVTALGGEDLTERNVTKFDDLAKQAPGLVLQPSSLGSAVPGFTIRSQRQYYPYMTIDHSVSIYFADVVQARPAGINSTLFDLSSVQVLKGPQGTLFGRNTTGGAIVATPQAPTRNFEGYLRGTLGNYDLRALEGVINVPVTSWLSVRGGGKITRRDGYDYNIFDGTRLNDEHSNTWRFSAAIDLGAFTNTLVLNGLDVNERGISTKEILLRPGSTATTAYPTSTAVFDQIQQLPFHTVDSNLKPNATKLNTFGLSNIAAYDLGGVTIKNIFGYRAVDSDIAADYDGSPFPTSETELITNSKQISNELQILGTSFGGHLDWIGGFYYFRESGVEHQLGTQTGVIRVTGGDIVNRSYAFFAQGSLKLPFYEKLTLTAGIRQNFDDRHYAADASNYADGSCRLTDAAGAILNPCLYLNNASFNKLTYTLSAEWKPVDNLLIYVTHRRGYRTGGFNFSAVTPAGFTPFRPEIVSDYEAGAKYSWRLAGRPAYVSIAAYTDHYSDIQRNQATSIGGTIVSTIVNAADAQIKGGEFEAHFEPADGLGLSVFYAYSHAKYNSWIASGADLSPSYFSGAPEHQVGGNIDYEKSLGDHVGRAGFNISAFYQSFYYFGDDNYTPGVGYRPQQKIAARTLVDGRIRLNEIAGTGFSVAIFVKNLFNEKYYTGGVDLAPTLGYTGVQLGAPRTYGLETTFKF